MRTAAFAGLFLLCFAHPLCSGQTWPGPGPNNLQTFPAAGRPQPPLVVLRPQPPLPNAEANHNRLMVDVQELIVEAQALQQEIHAMSGGTVSAQSFKRSQKIESLSKLIRKTLKLN